MNLKNQYSKRKFLNELKRISTPREGGVFESSFPGGVNLSPRRIILLRGEYSKQI